MKLIFFAHPLFLNSHSMNKYAGMLAIGMRNRGHDVDTWQPLPVFYKIPAPPSLKKWLGYLDQYLLFPLLVRQRMRRLPANTLFVFTDQALGPWVPLAKKRLHVVHCHDFLAQRSALGEFRENPVSGTGRLYQSYIRKGYSSASSFISISSKTKEDLHRFLGFSPIVSEVVHNGLNQHFEATHPEAAGKALSEKLNIDLSGGYLLHIGGNQWYKNRKGVIELFNAMQNQTPSSLSLLMIGTPASEELKVLHNNSPYKDKIYFLTGVEDKWLNSAYSGAAAFLFPSLEEGFGWPIAEAMASGCRVVTTNEAPMTEVAGNCALLIDRRPVDEMLAQQWAIKSAAMINNLLQQTGECTAFRKQKGLENVTRFNPQAKLDEIERVYQRIVLTKAK